MPDYSLLPTQAMQAAMERYIESGLEPGSFLKAVLSNDLRGSYLKNTGRWDVDVGYLMQWLQEEAPAVCWGSEDNFRDWRLKFITMGEIVPIDIHAMDVVK